MTIPLTKLLNTAKQSTHPKNMHATLIFRGSALLSEGYNHDGRHSEEVAVGKVWPNKLRKTHAINIMISKKSGKLGVSSRPCESCMSLLRNVGVSKVTYFSVDKFISEKIKERG